MPRLQALLECIGQALCEKGRKALQGHWAFADILHDVAKVAYDLAHRKLPGPDLRIALGDAAAVEPHEYDRRIGDLIADLSQTHAVPKAALAEYLQALPPAVRQMFRRPSDPAGKTAPEKLVLYKAEDLLPFLPPRLPRFKAGDRPAGLDNWTLAELQGLGECSEVWRGEDPSRPDHSPAALKFAIDPDSRDRIKAGTELFQKVFTLNSIPGFLPLRSVYLETDPPCLEAPFVFGYDLAGVMLDWKFRYDVPKPEASLKLLRRLTAIIAEAHGRGVVHRDLKPSNVMLHPTEGGKFTMWVSDFGWGQIESPRSLELAKGGPRGGQLRLAPQGAATALYASPQQAKKEPPIPADDVHALGVIWFQLLKRDPSAAAPVGNEWVEEFRPHGFTDSQARVLQMCLATRPDKRPKDAATLAALLGQVAVAPPNPAAPDGSKLIALKTPSSGTHAPVVATTTARGKTFDAEKAAAQAAALLSAAGGLPLTAGGSGSGGPLSTTGVKLIKNSLGMVFVRVTGGSFRMGSPDNEPGHREHEAPVHDVKIPHSYFLGVFPVTQVQYERVMGRNPSKFSKAHGGGPDHPVENLSWHDAEKFCERLAEVADEAAHRRSYRLPTEAEWEYACRAGTETAFSCGSTLTGKDALFSGAGGKYAGKSTGPAGAYPANPIGLHDMHGNVQEWCADWYEEYYYFDSPKEYPRGPQRGTLKVVRGGCWAMLPADCRSAARRGHDPRAPSDTIGFRVIMVVG
ncbi:MAG TPA: SUMF1/EgtB/PvdO family nonheme iron enzyme [Gemmataceae bacterium]|nr:SUMF1/EgtB/PvdO family nonheme iron enzyme [Gemmataceae bacterium]